MRVAPLSPVLGWLVSRQRASGEAVMFEGQKSDKNSHRSPYAVHSPEAAPTSSEARETWRILRGQIRETLDVFRRRIHPAHVVGFDALFGSSASIPDCASINQTLKQFNWQTIPVEGYIRPRLYAKLVARRTFPVAKKLRSRKQLYHSPTPDLAHDLLGHLPMLLCPQHRRFLADLGEAMSKAVSDERDDALYVAQRRASALREMQHPPADEAAAAEREVSAALRALRQSPSQLARLSRFYLWTIEFGLLGTDECWVAYGAGLLSSPAELRLVLSENANIQPLSPEAWQRDIAFSAPQRRYFVGRDYAHLRAELSRAVEGFE